MLEDRRLLLKKQIKSQKRVKKGNTILLHYTARFNDGSVIGSNKNNEPLVLIIGKDQIHRTLKTRIVGMKEGESQIVTIPASKAFGSYKKNLVFVVDKKKFDNPNIGACYKIRLKNGDLLKARIVDVDDFKVTIDANHILAGKILFMKLN